MRKTDIYDMFSNYCAKKQLPLYIPNTTSHLISSNSL